MNFDRKRHETWAARCARSFAARLVCPAAPQKTMLEARHLILNVELEAPLMALEQYSLHYNIILYYIILHYIIIYYILVYYIILHYILYYIIYFIYLIFCLSTVRTVCFTPHACASKTNSPWLCLANSLRSSEFSLLKSSALETCKSFSSKAPILSDPPLKSASNRCKPAQNQWKTASNPSKSLPKHPEIGFRRH